MIEIDHGARRGFIVVIRIAERKKKRIRVEIRKISIDLRRSNRQCCAMMKLTSMRSR